MGAGRDPRRRGGTARTGLKEIARVVLPGVAATERLAAAIVRLARRGDVIGLVGELGCGKTTFARAFLRARARLRKGKEGGEETPTFEVPSPTFTLVETYDLPGVPVWHFDLYRIESPDEAVEIGFDEALGLAITLIEWPERLGGLLPADRLEVRLAFADGEDSRIAVLTGSAGWVSRLEGALADV